MPKIEIQGLKGLPGLNRLSGAEKNAFMEAHKDILNTQNFRSPRALKTAAEVLYNNDLFIDKFGKDRFNELDDQTEASYNFRNTLLKNTIIAEEGNKRFNPFVSKDNKTIDKNKGFGNLDDWYTFNDMTPEGQLALMESDYLTTPQFEAQWKKEEAEAKELLQNRIINPHLGGMGMLPGVNKAAAEAGRQAAKEKNDRIFQKIYNDDLKRKTHALEQEVSAAYLQGVQSNRSDDQWKKAFYDNFINENSPLVKEGGAGEYAARWGSSEMKDFGIDDMRQALAKLAVYSKHMSPKATATALNNEAKEYIRDHQGRAKRFGLFARDVGISALSYTADKVNGLYNIGLGVADKVSGAPVVWQDDKGNVVDPNTPFYTGEDGKLHYKDDDQEERTVHQAQINRRTLHNMGKNFDGSEDTSILNPQYWTRAEQFGTLDEEEQKQYERLGASPYKVAYGPNEDSDLWYEVFKMMSFSIADAVAQLIPFGVGLAGKALNTVSRVGRIGRGFGRALDWSGRALTAQTRTGQLIQGGAGAAGIAYAYNRGTFQETLAQNLAQAEETLNNRSRREVYDRYHQDKTYKASIDARIDIKARELRDQYLKKAPRDGDKIIVDAVDRQAKEQAKEEILGQEVQATSDRLRKSKDWEQLQDRAIQGAGQAAWDTFLPEAVKYGLVNTVGFRKWLYTNPSGVSKKVSESLKGLKEITTEGGRKRLTTEASKFLTSKDKWKQFGKTVGSQMWGGAWTNGTDDMMVDAAERINADSYDRYLNGFLHDEAVADTYGFMDGFYSYMHGLSNSMGQGTTQNAALVGALGSLVSASPNMVNIAHLMTKNGREAYRNNFMQRYVRNEDGTLKRDENGQPLATPVKWHENPGSRLSYFIQNGVLSTYYGKRQAERDLQSHADFVNSILDDYNDFQDIVDLVASDKAFEESENKGEGKTARFIKAMYAVNTLNNLANDRKDPATLSSVVSRAKDLVNTLSEMDFNPETDALPTDEATQNLINQYYAVNPSEEHNDHTAKQALATMIHNAKELKEATEAYNQAEAEVQKAERNNGNVFAYPVREKLKLNRALDGHWRSRLNTMQEEIGDHSLEGEIADDNILPSVGGKKNAKSLVEVYDRQEKELREEEAQRKQDVEKRKKELEDSRKALSNNKDESKVYDLQKKVIDAQAKVEDAELQAGYIHAQLATTLHKKARVENALKNAEQEGFQDKVLTADEIMALDPVSRARVMRKENRELYSDAQKAEIEKLEKKLLMKDSDALQKVQDIALLAQRIRANADAYGMILQNPEAAAMRFEAQRDATMTSAYGLINQKNAHVVADWITQADEALSVHPDISEAHKENWVYRQLRQLHPRLLGLIDDGQMLPKYQKQVTDAIEWSKVVTDLDAFISQSEGTEEQRNALRSAVDGVLENTNSRQEIMSNLERAIDESKDVQVSQGLENILRGMEKLGHQRDSTVVENRKARRERAEAQKKEQEEQKQEAQKAAQEAAKKAEATEKTSTDKKKENPSPATNRWTEEMPEHVVEEGRDELIEGSQEDVPIDGNPSPKAPPQESQESVQKEADKTDTPSIPVTVVDDVVQARRETLDEQHADTGYDKPKNEIVEDIPTGTSSQNEVEETRMKHNATTLPSNVMSEYNPKELAENGRLVHKKGVSPNDSMNRFYRWMESAGIHLQNIIDDELALILKNSPHAKVKFMVVNPSGKGTDDVAMQNHLLLVIDYDNHLNKGITSIHQDKNGGGIESQGKKYLIIGVAGYNAGNIAQRDLYDILYSNNPHSPNGYGIMRRGRKHFFDAHPEERYWVNEEISTEIVPGSLIPGYIVRQLEDDAQVQFRPVTELLADERRNPQGWTLEDISWGIQEHSKFMQITPKSDRNSGGIFIRGLRNPQDNAGRTFVAIPASNGSFIPAYIKPLFYTEMRDGKLKDRTVQLLNDFTSPDYQTRLDAIMGLYDIFYLDNEGGDGFLTRKSKGEISLVHAGQIFRTFVLDEQFDRRAFMEAIADMNPRINITSSVLQNNERLKEYAEAGALDTDIAKVGTAGSSYSIYGIDAHGQMLQEETPKDNDRHKEPQANGGYRNENRQQVIFKHKYYTLSDGTYYLNGIPVTNEQVLRQLDVNRRINEGELTPLTQDSLYAYYTLSTGDNPQMVRVNRNTKVVEEITQEQAQKVIESVQKKQEEADRRKAAKEALENAPVVELNMNDEISGQEGTLEMDPITGEMIVPTDVETSNGTKEESPDNERKERNGSKQEPSAPSVAPASTQESHATQTFAQLYSVPKQMMRISKLVASKWKDVPKASKDLMEYLRAKNIEVDAIGTSQEAIDAWIKTIEECR